MEVEEEMRLLDNPQLNLSLVQCKSTVEVVQEMRLLDNPQLNLALMQCNLPHMLMRSCALCSVYSQNSYFDAAAVSVPNM